MNPAVHLAQDDAALRKVVKALRVARKKDPDGYDNVRDRSMLASAADSLADACQIEVQSMAIQMRSDVERVRKEQRADVEQAAAPYVAAVREAQAATASQLDEMKVALEKEQARATAAEAATAARLAWVRHHLQKGEVDAARELGWRPDGGEEGAAPPTPPSRLAVSVD